MTAGIEVPEFADYSIAVAEPSNVRRVGNSLIVTLLPTLVPMSQATILLSSSSIILQGTLAGSGYLEFVHIV
tara:strand:- start:1072 stop:1287 length:216 start_codon:yes stop_codon:yes gene_type:complete